MSGKPFVMPPPHPKERRIIFENISKPGYDATIETYLAHGGYESLRKAVTMKPAEIVDAVKASNLRGRGGAGFPCGAKWGFIKYDDGKPHYIVVNADESEPGTFKDRYILHYDPHQLIEGLAISAYATNTHLCYIYIRCEFPEAASIVWNAIQAARAKGFVGKNILNSGFDVDIYVHQGAGAYICGEETSLLESLEGKRPYPRIKPPYFPAVLGLYLKPTIVNNVETICHVKHILRLGACGVCKDGDARRWRNANHVRQRRCDKTGVLRIARGCRHAWRIDLRHLWRPEAGPKAQGGHSRRKFRKGDASR